MKEHLRKKEFVILSAELESNSEDQNKRATLNLANCLDDLGLSFKQVQGCYKGSSEVSFMVMTPCEESMEAVKDLGLKSFGQESVLFRDRSGVVYLIYTDSMERLGTFKQVEEAEAKGEEGYTKVGDRYWIVK